VNGLAAAHREIGEIKRHSQVQTSLISCEAHGESPIQVNSSLDTRGGNRRTRVQMRTDVGARTPYHRLDRGKGCCVSSGPCFVGSVDGFRLASADAWEVSDLTRNSQRCAISDGSGSPSVPRTDSLR
jgi:hypothetical protein